MLTKRQKQLLKDIIENHIITSEPVGSKLLAGKKKWCLSPATLRNEMAVLEKEGLLMQPHISAGRTPTAAGYQYYRDNFLKPTLLNKQTKDALVNAYKGAKALDDKIKLLAKTLANISDEAIIVAFGKRYIYYTGLCHLVEQPEFFGKNEIYDMIAVLDDCEPVVNDLLENMSNKIYILIGSENPFIEFCSFTTIPFQYAHERAFIGVLGPMRMDYNKNYSLAEFCHSLLLNR